MDDMQEVFLKLLDWHKRKVQHLRSVSDKANEGTTLKMGNDEIVFTERDANLFKLGIESALIELGELPIKITQEEAFDETDSE